MEAFAAITVLGVVGAAALLLAGALLGVFVDHLLTPRLDRRSRRKTIERAIRRRRAFDYAGRPLEFAGVDVGLHVLFGTLGRSVQPVDVIATLSAKTWRAPADLRRAAADYGARMGFYDGTVARLESLDVETYSDADRAERHRLRLGIRPTGYYDMLATNVALGPFTLESAPLLRGRGGLADTQLSNMMGLDLTLVTRDGHVPVFFRSPKMAALSECWQASSGETVQLPVDLDTDGRPDVFATARRGLHEELGVEAEQLSRIALTAIVATPEFAGVGILMVANLAMTTAEFEVQLNRHVMIARDNWEYTRHSLLAIDDASELASALTAPARRWTKQAVASLVFAHAERANGNVATLADAIAVHGQLNLEAGEFGRHGLAATPLGANIARRYCTRCGSELEAPPPTTCRVCQSVTYSNPKPCGEAVIVRNGLVLLVRRGEPPWRGYWDVPGGFCNQTEHPMRAAERELNEELGLKGYAIAYLGTWIDTYGAREEDPDDIATLNVAYLVHLNPANASLTLRSPEITDVAWFPLSELPTNLAFPSHLPDVMRVARQVSMDPTAAADLHDRPPK